mgnify:CR=1 FL=1
MAHKATKDAFETVTSNLGQLSRGELVELADIVAALLVATKEESDDQVADLEDLDVKPAAKGHIEAKTINGCGPYLYLRYWSGKTLKSKYIGKAKGTP